MPDQIHKFTFAVHGLGDQSNAIHLFDQWRRAGDKFIIAAGAFRWLWEACGYTTCDTATAHHPWLEPMAARREFLHEPWDGAKVGRNITEHPLEWIGAPSEVWPRVVATRFDLDHAVPQDAKDRVARLIDGMPRPLIVWHSRGTTSPGRKNPPANLETDIGHALLDLGSVVYCQWSHGGPDYRTYRFRTAQPDLPTLYWLTRSADLFVGVDSGPYHYARFTRTPRVGLWFDIPAWHASLPSPETVNIVLPHGNNAYKRLDFNMVELPAFTGERIGAVLKGVLGPRRFCDQVGPDCVLASLLPKLRHRDNDLTTVVDRNRSVGMLFDFLRTRSRPRVLETGCIRSVDDWGAGWFTSLCGYFLQQHGGELVSVDINAENVTFARTWTRKLPVQVVESCSLKFLDEYSGPPFDAVYLDSLDTQQPGHEAHCLRELRAASRHLAEGGLVLIDDSPCNGERWVGKGGSAIPWALEHGWELVWSGYQCLLRRRA